MLILDRSTIRLDARARDKAEAIRLVGRLLVEAGHIETGYVDSMLAREKVANTYLGNGISIPHGLPKDRELILRTGIAVLQLPAGVEWNPGETARLVIGIAARSDEHIEVLTNLTHVLDDADTIRRLSSTTDADDIIEVLSGRKASPASEAASQPAPEDYPNCLEVTVPMRAGLHARPATTFVELAKGFHAEVRVRHLEKTANGKSMVSLLKLGAQHGAVLRLSTDGPDAAAALEALRVAVETGLGDEDEVLESVTHRWAPSQARATVPGLSASPGLAIGPLHHLKHTTLVFEPDARDPAAEEERLRHAIASALVDLDRLHQETKERSGAGKAAIFRAHAEFLEDPDLHRAAIELLRSGRSAGWAWQKTFMDQAGDMERMKDPLLSGRAVDLRDVGTRVLRLLAGVRDEDLQLPDQPVLLLAEELSPSDTAKLDPAQVLGFCTALGGPTSHTAILARSLDIPAVVGAGPAVLHQPEGALAILDGSNGVLYIEPGQQDLLDAQALQTQLRTLRNEEHLRRFEPAVTRDGHRVEVVANIGLVPEAEQAANAGGEGVGLLRTEFLFLDRDTAPTEDEQYRAYAAMVQALNGLPLILRTLDIGGDKQIPYLDLPSEENPFLGIRGIRLCLTRPDLFLTQLRAVYRASKHGPIKLMFPMIATLGELLAAKQIAEQVRHELGAEPLEIGIMIEVPSAVEMADHLAEEADFFSVGTNDLTQYVLAMDRGHPVLSAQADGLHPAVLRMIDRAVKAMTAAGKWVGVCGGIAGDPLGAAILVGLGVTELSVSIPAIPAVKAKIRKLLLTEAQDLARRALRCKSAADVRGLSRPSRGERPLSAAPGIVTVTLNPAIDQMVHAPGFRAGQVNRVERAHSRAGGKGVNVATTLAGLGFETTATGLLGSENASLFEQHFARLAIQDRFVRLPGSTRVNMKIQGGDTTDLNFPGLPPGPAHLQDLHAVLAELAAPGRWIVLAGSLPPGTPSGIYQEWIAFLKSRGCRVALDTSGEPLQLALEAAPDLVKPNVLELGELLGRKLHGLDEIVLAARGLLERGIRQVVVSMGAEGAVFLDREGALLARPVQVQVLGTVGAGDAMVSGTIAGLARGLPLSACARLATALSANAISQPETGVPSRSLLEELEARVVLEPIT